MAQVVSLRGMRSIGLLAALAAIPSAYAADWLHLEAGVWRPSLSGDAAYSGRSYDAGEFGIDNAEAAADVRARINIPFPFVPTIWAGYTDWSTEGSSTVGPSGNFGNLNLPAGIAVEGETNFQDVSAAITWGLSLVGFGFDAGVAVHRTAISVSASSSGQSDELSGDWLLPMLALGAHVGPFFGFTATVDVHGVPLELDGISADYLDGRAQIAWEPVDFVGFSLGVALGWRLIDVDIKDELSGKDAAVAVRLSGPYLGLLAGF